MSRRTPCGVPRTVEDYETHGRGPLVAGRSDANLGLDVRLPLPGLRTWGFSGCGLAAGWSGRLNPENERLAA